MSKKNNEILLVDDRRENLELLSSFLVDRGYKIRSALNGTMALGTIAAKKPDLILLDIEMPDINGYEVCKKLKNNSETKNIPIIFISAHDDVEAKIKAFQNGGVDYISKPFANEEVVARVKMHLELAQYQHSLEDKVQEGLAEIRHLNEDLELTQQEMIMTLSTIMETRDDDTGNHVIKVAEYTKLLAEFYGLDKKTIDIIYKATPFHDAGKVAIPDNILNKPGKLDADEWEIMKSHSIRGYEIFKDTTRPILKMAAIIAKEHHEYWNGKGYPDGLKGEEIHIAGRLVVLADVFDALTSERVYKRAWSIEEATKFIQEQRGEMFDPKIVDIFLAHINEFVAIYNRLKD
jgi:putative two-component system response regulator